MARSASSSNPLLAVVLRVATILLNACGGGGGAGAYPRFAYVANSGDGTISIYTADAATGQLCANGYAAAGTEPASVTTAGTIQ